MEAALVKYMKQETNTAVAGRVFLPTHVPETAKLPYIVVQCISLPRSFSFGSRRALAEPRMQFSCWGRSAAEARAVAEAVHDALWLKRGELVDGCSILLAKPDGESDIEDQGTPGRRLDYRITYVE